MSAVLDPPATRATSRVHTADTVLRTRPRAYRQCVQFLAQGDSVDLIARTLKISDNTVRAIRVREAATVAERKQSLMSIFANVAEIAGERMEQLASKAKLSEAGVCAGIATDKLLALSGEPTQRIEVNITADNILSQLQQVAQQIAQVCNPPAQAQIVDAEFKQLDS